eukprot:TRINITY_DN18628_c0_g1_i1.p1 TRINITY_DN18628_c0_g1~~TRINITY_DN18628_c0_g1_i1.p1  ORF type:complete len:106 (+),score=23.30 TRINITY_DN18628_c0_g1_i1:75-392(+)
MCIRDSLRSVDQHKGNVYAGENDFVMDELNRYINEAKSSRIKEAMKFESLYKGEDGRSEGRNLEFELRQITFMNEPSLLVMIKDCLLYTSPSPRDRQKSRMPSSA